MSDEILKALIDPAVVALVGASDDASKLTARPMRFLRANGFSGALRPVNPTRESVLGEKAYSALSKIPERVDHAYLLVPTGAVISAVQECAEAGCPSSAHLAQMAA